jgi:hypothetical protein
VAIVKLAEDGTPLERVAFVEHPTETDATLLRDPGRTDWTSHAHSANFDATGQWLFVCEVRIIISPVRCISRSSPQVQLKAHVLLSCPRLVLRKG